MRNPLTVPCVRCGQESPAGTGDVHFTESGDPYVTCALCTLYEGIAARDLEPILSAFPRGGKSPYPYQVTDAKRIANVRAALLGSAMGVGKCRYPGDLDLINGRLLKAEDTWSSYASNPWFDGEGWWSAPSEPLFVNSLDNETGEITRGRVTNLYRQRVSERLRRITLDDGSQVTVTQAHELYKVDEWTNSIQPGDRACVPARLLHEEGEFDLELAELFGWAIGREHVTSTKVRRVPTPIMQSGPGPVRAFLRAHFDAGGSVVSDGSRIEVSSASQRLIKELSVLLRRFGVWLKVRKERDCWIGTISGPSVLLYRDEVGFSIGYKRGRLEQLREDRGRIRRLVDQEVFYAKVVSVEEFDYEGWVYDLEVDQHHNYVSEGVLCHNTVVAALGALREDRSNVVFCPASVTYNWVEEVGFWRPDLKAEVCTARSQWKWPLPGNVLVSSFGCIPGIPCAVCASQNAKACAHKHEGRGAFPPTVPRGAVVLIDEVQAIQNPDTKRRARWDLLADAVWEEGGRLLGVTGTCVSNSPNDAWEILKALKLERAAFHSREVFCHLFRGWLDQEKWSRQLPSEEEREVMLKLLRPVRVCRLRRHVLAHLPPVVHRKIKVELTPQVLKDVDEAMQKLLAVRRAWQDVQSGLLDNPRERSLSPDEKERRQLFYQEQVDMYFETRPWNTAQEVKDAVQEVLETQHQSPAFAEISKLCSMLTFAKISAAREQVELHEEWSEPLIVVCRHTKVLHELFDGRDGWEVLDGKRTKLQRQSMVKRFQSGELRCGLGLSTLAGGEGITLTRAGSMLRIDQAWNPARNHQARDRINRPGAEVHSKIVVTDLVADHAVDELVWSTVLQKESLMSFFEDEEASMAGLEAGAVA